MSFLFGSNDPPPPPPVIIPPAPAPSVGPKPTPAVIENIDTAAEEAATEAVGDAKRRRGFLSTIATSQAGITEPANVRKKKLGA